MNTDVVKLTSDLINIRSQSEIDGELEISRYIRDYLKDIGIKAEIKEFAKGRCNITASIGEGEGLMLNGHTDTVPIGNSKDWKYGEDAKLFNGRLYGRGASDMKGGLAAILAAIPDIDASKAKRRLLFTFVADEEVWSRGSEWMLKNNKELFKNVNYGIIAEPTDMNLQIAQKGHAELNLIVNGISAHGSRPELGKNAIIDMSKSLLALEKSLEKTKKEDVLLGRGTINIGLISGGTATNVVPDQCSVRIDRRLIPGENSKTICSQIKKALDPVGVDYRLEVKNIRPPFRLSESSYIVRFMDDIVKAKHTGSPGYTEAELYKSSADIDCIVFGPGTKAIIHKANEYVSVSNLVKSRKYFSKIMQSWCAMGL